MKKLLAWIFISPILLCLIWLACLGSKDIRDCFIKAVEKVFKNIILEIERHS